MARSTSTRTGGKFGLPARMVLIPPTEPLVPVGAGEHGIPTAAEFRAMADAPLRVQSLRAYRRLLDGVIDQMRRGRIAPNTGKAIAEVVKTAAELHMSERLLQAQGIEDREPKHVIDEDGGLSQDQVELPITPHQEITVRRRVGTGPDGNEFDETTVERRGGPDIAEDLP